MSAIMVSTSIADRATPILMKAFQRMTQGVTKRGCRCSGHGFVVPAGLMSYSRNGNPAVCVLFPYIPHMHDAVPTVL